jgi:hypothetical protein
LRIIGEREFAVPCHPADAIELFRERAFVPNRPRPSTRSAAGSTVAASHRPGAARTCRPTSCSLSARAAGPSRRA